MGALNAASSCAVQVPPLASVASWSSKPSTVAACFIFASHHEAGDVLQKEQRNVALARELDEMGALERALAEQDAVIAKDADGKTVNVSKAADQRLAIERLELVELGAIGQACDDIAHVVGNADVGRHD